MHVPIQPAEKGEIGRQRRNICIHGVVDFYRNHVVRPDLEEGGDIKSKRGKPALMFADETAIDIDIGHGKRPVKFQKETPAREVPVHRVMLSIPADAAVVIFRVAFSIEIVPRVRQIQICPRRIVEPGGLRPGDILPDKPPVGIHAHTHPVIGGRSVTLGCQRKSCAKKQRANQKHPFQQTGAHGNTGTINRHSAHFDDIH